MDIKERLTEEKKRLRTLQEDLQPKKGHFWKKLSDSILEVQCILEVVLSIKENCTG